VEKPVAAIHEGGTAKRQCKNVENFKEKNINAISGWRRERNSGMAELNHLGIRS